jgi:hypothetical protein
VRNNATRIPLVRRSVQRLPELTSWLGGLESSPQVSRTHRWEQQLRAPVLALLGFCAFIFPATGQQKLTASGLEDERSTATLSLQPVDKGSIAGVVVDFMTGEPLTDAHIRITPVHTRLTLGTHVDPWNSYGAISKEQGQFSITTIPPGTYELVIEQHGFLFVPNRQDGIFNGRFIELRSTEVKNVKLAMVRCAVISGRVLDEYDEPMGGVPVRVMPTRPRLTWCGNGPYIDTDDRGEYRLLVGPGRYRILAGTYSHSPLNEPQELRTDGTKEEVYHETYYPNVIQPELAGVVAARPGADLTGIDIRLAHSAPLSISGTISGVPEDAKWCTLVLESETGSVIQYGVQVTDGPTPRVDKKFSISNLYPGTYRLYARLSEGSESGVLGVQTAVNLQSQKEKIVLANSSVDYMDLLLTPGIDVKGALKSINHTAKIEPARRFVTLVPLSDGRSLRSLRDVVFGPVSLGWGRPPTTYTSAIEADGVFKVSGVHAGVYRVELTPMIGSSYVQKVLFKGRELPNATLDLRDSTSDATLEIIVSENGGIVRGTVTGNTQVSPFTAVVCLFSDNESPALDLMRWSAVGADGSYAVRGLRPGRYRLLALSDGLGLVEQRDLEQQYLSAAEIVDVKEGDTIVKDPKPLSLIEDHDELPKP